MTKALYLGLSVACCIVVVSCNRHEAVSSRAATEIPPAIRYEAHVPAGGRQPDGAVPPNPARADASSAKNGAVLFTAMNCDGCHGGDAGGWVGPSLTDGRWRYGGADEEVFASIYFGRPRGMPAFGAVLGAPAVWNIVAYLESLTPAANVPTESWQ
jgi:mono/diheme cytochrome c family protein